MVSAFFAREDLLVEVRINKFLSEAGVCSRREADRQIEAGNVTIDGRIAQMGDKVEAGQMYKTYWGMTVNPFSKELKVSDDL